MKMKINVEYDTVEKTMIVSMDGKTMEDVIEVNFYNHSYQPNDAHVGIVQHKRDETQDTVVVTRTMANHNGVTKTTENQAEVIKSLANCLFRRKVV